MKTLKKISLAYFLQVVAVVLLFSYKDVSPANEKKEPGNSKPSATIISTDSILVNKLNDLPKLYIGKSW